LVRLSAAVFVAAGAGRASGGPVALVALAALVAGRVLAGGWPGSRLAAGVAADLRCAGAGAASVELAALASSALALCGWWPWLAGVLAGA
jgi:hypothetical protein